MTCKTSTWKWVLVAGGVLLGAILISAVLRIMGILLGIATIPFVVVGRLAFSRFFWSLLLIGAIIWLVVRRRRDRMSSPPIPSDGIPATDLHRQSLMLERKLDRLNEALKNRGY